MGKDAPVLFHEEQAFRRRHAAVVMAQAPALLVFVTLRQLVWHRPWTSPPVSNGDLLFLTGLTVVVYARLLTVRLVTDVRPMEVAVGLHGLWRKRRIPLNHVRRARPIEFDPIHDFGGYGIRSGRRCQAYIARGRAGVELEMQDGRKIVIGSQNPGRLAQQIAACRFGAPA